VAETLRAWLAVAAVEPAPAVPAGRRAPRPA
jgi:hypothetical protein